MVELTMLFCIWIPSIILSLSHLATLISSDQTFTIMLFHYTQTCNIKIIIFKSNLLAPYGLKSTS